jgi:F-type H+-transporting ATPase subunit delta
VKPREGALANRYARALFQVPSKEACLHEVRADVASLGEVWKDNPEFTLLLLNPRLTKAKVTGMLDALLEKMKAHVVSKQFIHLLLEKDRLNILPALVPSFEKLWRDHEGEIEVIVTTAVPVSDPLQAEIKSYLSNKSGKKPIVEWKYDPSILGGIIIQWPDKVFDGSLARKLDVLKDRMSEAV